MHRVALFLATVGLLLRVWQRPRLALMTAGGVIPSGANMNGASGNGAIIGRVSTTVTGSLSTMAMVNTRPRSTSAGDHPWVRLPLGQHQLKHSELVYAGFKIGGGNGEHEAMHAVAGQPSQSW